MGLFKPRAIPASHNVHGRNRLTGFWMLIPAKELLIWLSICVANGPASSASGSVEYQILSLEKSKTSWIRSCHACARYDSVAVWLIIIPGSGMLWFSDISILAPGFVILGFYGALIVTLRSRIRNAYL